MKEKSYEYFQARIRKAEQIIELNSLAEFVRYAHANHIRQIICANDLETGYPCFTLTSKGALYMCLANGFNNLEDYILATENGFPDASTFYIALEKKCTTYSEYEIVLDTGITEGEVFDEMKKSGYVEGFRKFDEARKQKLDLPQLIEIQNAKDLFDYAKEKMFEDFRQFFKVWEAGFADLLAYEVATGKGLNNASDYAAFKKGNFNSVIEFNMAKPLQIESREELSQYGHLDAADYPKSSSDELLLLSILSKLDNGSKTEFQKLYNYFVKTEEDYKRPNENGEMKFYKWYVKRLRTEKDVKDFLVNSDFAKRFGTFDSEREILETIPIKRRKVVVDGSNVAHNSNMADRKKGVFNAEMKNILLMVKKLKNEYQFEEIHVISDSNLIHKVKDKELLKDIKALCRYSESPPGVPADLYLINHVKKHHCLLVTNDTFQDWKLGEKWIEDNIDFYRLKFVLNGDIVMLPHMERFGK